MRLDHGTPSRQSRSILPAVLGSTLLALGLAACAGEDGKPSRAAPKVDSTAPSDAATGVPTSSVVVAYFSQPMAAFAASTFTLRQGTAPVAGTVTASSTGTSASFAPAAPLAPGTVYSATISTAATSAAGTALAADKSWSFTTGAAPDTTPPTVSATSPAPGATGVGTNTKITATFSKALDPTSITAAAFTVAQGASAVAGVVTYGPGSTATFAPAAALAGSLVFTVTVTGVKDLSGNALASPFAWTFTTGSTADTTPPTVSATSPAAGDTAVGSNTKIAANFSKALDPASVTAASFTVKQGTAAVAGAVTYGPGSTATFTPAAALASSSVFTATLTAVKDLAGNALAVPFTWSFTTGAAPDTTPPTVLTTSPAFGATGVATNATVAVTFSKAIDPSTIGAASLTLKQGSAAVAGTVTSGPATSATFKPSAALAASTVYTATVTTAVKDLAGNALAGAVSWSFTTGSAADTTPPTVIGTGPSNGDTGVAINAKVTATFSKVIDPLSVTASTFLVVNASSSVAVVGSVSYGPGILATFNAAGPLASDTLYLATLTTGIKDLAGNKLANPFTWRFKTGAAPDTTPPVVSATNPLAAATGAALNVTPAATFSKAMDPSTITAASFTLRQGATAVPGAVAYGPGTTATFAPTSPLTSGTLYTASVSTAAKDLLGNALANTYSWSFTTGAAVAKGPGPVGLGAAGSFVVMAKTAITTVPGSAITGDIALSPSAATYITGFTLIIDSTNVFATSSQVTGKVYAADYAVPTPSNLTTAIHNMEAAFTDAAGRPTPDFLDKGAGELGGLTLAPGLYTFTTGVTISNDVTLTGAANDVWIFQTPGTLIMSSAKHVVLAGGALAKNVFWQVADDVRVGTTAHFEGILLGKTQIIFETGSSLKGRMLAQTQVVLQQTTVVAPEN